MSNVQVIHADCRDALKDIADCSIDSVCTDPPYALVSITKRFGNVAASDDTKTSERIRNRADGYARAASGFMGSKWDTGDTAFDPAFWYEVLRVLKPGAHLLSFGGTRTYHRMACAIEDAGFEIRDMVSWLYGSGFPKSHDVSKGIDRAAGAEREVIGFRKPEGSGIAGGATPDQSGSHIWTGSLRSNIAATDAARQWQGWGTALKPALEPICLARKPLVGTVAANVLEHGTGALNIDACRIATDEAIAAHRNTARNDVYGKFNEAYQPGDAGKFINTSGRWPANCIHDGSEEVVAAFPDEAGGGFGKRGGQRQSEYGLGGTMQDVGYGDSGSPARFFYTSKADADDRLGSKHPTVKPVDLIAYLCRLITPPGGTILDPFAGSGTTGMAAMREGFHAILIEREAQYVADIKRRIAHVSGYDTPLFQDLR